MTSLFCFFNIPEHFQNLEKVLSCLVESGLKLKLSKCHFLQKETKFLGHVIDTNGIHTSQDKIQIILDYPAPTNVDETRSFLGLAGYYRRFIKAYVSIAFPLTALLKKDVIFNFSTEHEHAFATLKQALTNAPVLAYLNYDKPFILNTDASYTGLGAILMQECDCKNRPVVFASCLLNKAEKNYSVTDLEALAVVWALKRFRYIIHG